MNPIGHQNQAFKGCILWVAATEARGAKHVHRLPERHRRPGASQRENVESAPSLSLGKIAISPEVKVS